MHILLTYSLLFILGCFSNNGTQSTDTAQSVDSSDVQHTSPAHTSNTSHPGSTHTTTATPQVSSHANPLPAPSEAQEKPIPSSPHEASQDASSQPIPPVVQTPPEYPTPAAFLGAYYMPKPAHITHQWYSLKAGSRALPTSEDNRARKPLLGYYPGDNADVLAQQIIWAKQMGLSFFAFDEYWVEHQASPVYDGSLQAFRKAAPKTPFGFAILLTSLTMAASSPTARKAFLKETIAPYWRDHYFGDQSYVRIGGKPVVFIHVLSALTGDWDYSSFAASTLLSEIEQVVGEPIHWVYAYVPDTADNSAVFAQLAQAGISSISSYYIAPGVTNTTSSGDPTNGISYVNYIYNASLVNHDAHSQAASSGLGYIPNATPNFDERFRYPLYTWYSKRSFSKDPNAKEYEKLLSSLHGLASSTQSMVPKVDGKPMLLLGAWNEWEEDAQLEPGANQQNNGDPFALAAVIRKEFTNPPTTNWHNAVSPKDFTPTVTTLTSWDFATPADRRFWYQAPNMSDFQTGAEGGYAYTMVDGDKFLLEGAVALDASTPKKLHIAFRSQCGTATGCTASILVDWYGYDGKNMINGSVGASIAAGDCSTTDDFTWTECVLNLNGTSWRGTIDYLRLVFFPKVGQNYPFTYNLGNIEVR